MSRYVPIGPLLPPDSNFSSIMATGPLKVDTNIFNSDTTITNLVVSGSLVANNTTISNSRISSSTISDLSVDTITSAVAYSNTNDAYNQYSGSIRTAGGIGLVKDLYAGGTVNAVGGFATDENDSNSRQGAETLVAGLATVANTSLSYGDRIFLTIQNPNGGTPGSVYVKTMNYGSSFIMQSTSDTDTSVVAYEIFGASGFICFHESCYVNTPEGSVKIDELVYGQEVLVYENGLFKYSPVITYTGFFPDREGQCTTIFYDNDGMCSSSEPNWIRLSGIHLVYACGPDKKEGFYRAMDLTIGMSLLTSCKIWKNIISLSSDTKIGWYSPLTREGTIVVNDIVSSCHTTNHKAARIMYWPYQIFLWFCPNKIGAFPDKNKYQWFSVGFRRSFVGRSINKFLEYITK